MFETIEIKNFRCFQELRVEGLRRVNLIVGKNNAGKTTLLDAVHFLAKPFDSAPLWHALVDRGELLEAPPTESQAVEHVADVSHLFHGHQVMGESTIDLTATVPEGQRQVRISLGKKSPPYIMPWDPPAGFTNLPPRPISIEEEKNLTVASDNGKIEWPISVTSNGLGISLYSLGPPTLWNLSRAASSDSSQTAVRIGILSLPSDFVAKRWKEIALTQDEDWVLSVLRILEPSVERIAYVGQEAPSWLPRPTSSISVRLKGSKHPVPIGSLGEGTWRMLILALALVRAKGGILLVDEIDTGLHHTVLEDMWRMVAVTAQRLDIQVFATTHSNDCIEGLAAACESLEKEGTRDIASIQRVESGKPMAVGYTEEDLLIAAEHHIEVR